MRWLPDGNLEFLGRLDHQVRLGFLLPRCSQEAVCASCSLQLLVVGPKHVVFAGTQVKLRGFRVELGEVEHALAHAPGVELVVVSVIKDPAGTQRLVAYVTPAAVDPAAVLAAIGARLPAHMVPSVVVPLAAMPRLPNGKISRSALPPPEWGAGAAEEYVAPVNELEAQLQAVWQEVLGRERVSTQADFFAVGGNSLQVRLLCSWRITAAPTMPLLGSHQLSVMGCLCRQVGIIMARVREATGSDIASAQLFRTPTIAGLAAFLGSTAPGDDAMAAIPVAAFSPEQRHAGVPCSANQAQMAALYEMDPDSSAYHMSEALRLRGALNVSALEAALRALATWHESLRTRLLERDGRLLQSVLPAEQPHALPMLLRHSVRGQGSERAAQELIDRETHRPFRLMDEVPIRVVLVEMAPDHHALLFAMHHVIRCAAWHACSHHVHSLALSSTELCCCWAPCFGLLTCELHGGSDGWSMGIFYEELGALYNAALDGRACELPPLPIQYADFAAWQAARLEGEHLQAQLGYWTRQLAGAPPLLELPTDLPRPALRGGASGYAPLRVPADVSQRLRDAGLQRRGRQCSRSCSRPGR